jgi:quinol monooxygenase YgiN
MTDTKALLAILEAKPGKETELAALLKAAQDMARDEPQTNAWYAFQMTPSTFGIFDTFSNEEGRQAHLNGDIAKALVSKADELLASGPDIKPVDIIASK